MLLPFVVPTVLSAIAFWWIYDPQFSIISWALIKARPDQRTTSISSAIPGTRAGRSIAANVWRGIPFVAITLLAGLQTISPSLYEAATLDGATPWQRFRHVTLPMLSPIIAVVMTFSVLLTFTDFQLIYAITRGGPINATHLMATLSFQRAITGGHLGEGAAIADAMVPFLLAAILFSYFGLAASPLAAGREGLTMATADDQSVGMDYLERLPRRVRHALSAARPVPLRPAVPVLLDGDDDVQAGRGAVRLRRSSIRSGSCIRRWSTSRSCSSRPSYPLWMCNTMIVSVASTVDLAVCQRLRRLCDRTAALYRRALCRPRDLPRLSRAAEHPVHPAGGDRVPARPVRQQSGR